MNIVVIDGQTLNPGDLNLERLAELGNLKVYDTSTPEEAVERLKDADIAVINKVVVNKELIDQLPKLKYIAVTATGYNNIDVSYLQEKGILASNVANYGSHAVAQHAFALLLEITNLVALHHQACKDGQWNKSESFCFWNQPMTELYGKTLGIIGLGHIGLQTAKIGQAFGMNVLYHSRTDKKVEGMTFVSNPNEIFKQSDVISLHCILNEQTEKIINKQSLQLFKPQAILINTSRGGLIDEVDLLDALNQGLLAGVGLDVLAVEPPQEVNPLIHHERCVVTPHNAWAALETRQRLLDIAIDNIQSYLNNKPQNLIT